MCVCVCVSAMEEQQQQQQFSVRSSVESRVVTFPDRRLPTRGGAGALRGEGSAVPFVPAAAAAATTTITATAAVAATALYSLTLSLLHLLVDLLTTILPIHLKSSSSKEP